jgi:hypothetical protein
MAEWFAEQDGMPEREAVEAAIFSAGGYVRASDDLRPRLLDAVRMDRRERRARGYVRWAAYGLLLVAGMAAHAYRQFDASFALRQQLAAVSSEAIFLKAIAMVRPGGDLGWGMVESVSELRRRQADAISMTP